MSCVMKNPRLARKAFTLIEMIGVLAIIAILVAAVAPRIFEAIEDSKVTSASTMAKSVQVACTKYYADMGGLLPINNLAIDPLATANFVASTGAAAAGSLGATLTYTKLVTQTGGTWPRFRGPYMEGFSNNDAPLGTDMRLSAVAVAGALGAATVATNETNYDLSGDGLNDLDVPSNVISLVFNGVSDREWEKLDAIIDAAGLEGKNEAQRSAQGRVKFDAATLTVRIYIAHK